MNEGDGQQNENAEDFVDGVGNPDAVGSDQLKADERERHGSQLRDAGHDGDDFHAALALVGVDDDAVNRVDQQKGREKQQHLARNLP